MIKTSNQQITALYNLHYQNGAKFTAFNGYKMPLWFSSIKEEHLAVRDNAGLFDLSHMGVIKIKGNKVESFLQRICTNDISKCQNKMIYSMILNKEGGILDDITVGKFEETYILVVNAGNKIKIYNWLKKHNTNQLEIVLLKTSFIGIQGPNTKNVLKTCLNIDISNIKKFEIFKEKYSNYNIIGMRTGYTGEDGVELIVPNNEIESIFKKLTLGNVQLCGLGCRDTLRIEAGYPLYGQELSEEINPYMTQYSWAAKKDTPFIGKDALNKSSVAPLKAIGLIMKERVIPRTHYKIKEGGYISSGTLSPSLNKPIALAFTLPHLTKENTELTVIIRNKEHKGTVSPLPFI